MKTTIEHKEQSADLPTASSDNKREPASWRFSANQRWTFAIATLASLALAGGCCTKRETQASYTPLPATAYAEPAPPPPAPAPVPAPVPAPEPAAQANLVVPLHQEAVHVQKREVDAGDVHIKKIVKTETVNQPIELRHEEVVIERGPGTGEEAKNKALAQPFQPEETVIHLKREEPIIETQTRPAGEIVIRTRSTTEQTNVQAQVRREDIDLAQFNNTHNVIIGQNVTGATGTPAAVGGGETPGSRTTGTVTGPSGEIITDPSLLSSSDTTTTLVGRPVRFEHMKIRKVMGEHLIEIGNDNGRPIYAVCSDKAVSVKPGDQVIITGKLQTRAGFTPETGVDEHGAQLLIKQPYYIEVKKIEVAPQ